MADTESAVDTTVASAASAALESAALATKAQAALREIGMACAALEEAEDTADDVKHYLKRTAAHAAAASSNALAAFEPCTEAPCSCSIGYAATNALNAFEKAADASAAVVPAAREYDEALIAVADAKKHLATVVANAKKSTQKAYEAATAFGIAYA